MRLKLILGYLLFGLTGLTDASERWVSVNQCTDRMLAHLAPEKLVSVTWLSHGQSRLSIQPLLNAKPVNHGAIEEILDLKPTQVIAGTHGVMGLDALLPKFNIPMLRLSAQETLEGRYQQWRDVGGRLGTPDRADEVIRQLESVLEESHRQLAPLQLNVLLLTPNGWTQGNGQLATSLLTRMGLISLSADHPGWSQWSLEEAARAPMDALLIAQTDPRHFSHATQWLNHPLLKRLTERDPIEIHSGFLDCLGPETVTAVNLLTNQLLATRTGTRG